MYFVDRKHLVCSERNVITSKVFYERIHSIPLCSLVVIQRHWDNSKQHTEPGSFTHLSYLFWEFWWACEFNKKLIYATQASRQGKMEIILNIAMRQQWRLCQDVTEHKVPVLHRRYKGGCWERLSVNAGLVGGSEVGYHRKRIWVSYALWGAGVFTFSVHYCVPPDSFTATVTFKQRNTKLNT